MNSPDANDLENNFIDFEFEHNLALWFDGIFLKELFIFRIGNSIIITSGNLAHQVELEQGKNFFRKIGDYLHDNIQKTEYTEHALLAWKNRDSLSRENYIEMAIGGEVPQNIKNILYHHLPPPGAAFLEDEYFLAARTAVACSLDASELGEVFAIINEIPSGDIRSLDTFSRKCSPTTELPGEYPHIDGYRLAEIARSKLELDDIYQVDVERTLREKLGVHVIEKEFSIKIDAIAVWGSNRGPAVVVNCRHNARTSTSNGRRTALAHELCHLICDRKLTFPVAEVLCGQSPVRIEKRANAFAAEFLLPRQVAFRTVFHSESFEEALEKLTKGYGVSKVVAAWQIKNSSNFDAFDPLLQRSIFNLLEGYNDNYSKRGYAVGDSSAVAHT